MKPLRDLLWILPLSAAFAAILAFASPGSFWMGWLAYGVLLIPGLLLLDLAWRRAGSERFIFWTMGLALILRLAAALTFFSLLPVIGYETNEQKAGYVFTDAFRRDTQAWDLARSENSILEAFNKKHYTDQYGGLLALSALTYRLISPDAHRPLLIVLLAALTAALGVPFFWRAARQIASERSARLAAWIFALYPESILQGSAPMREPFLVTFVALAFYGLLEWQASHQRRAWVWIGLGLAGMLLVSPGIALVTLVILAGWLWLSQQGRRIPWPALAAAALLFLLALVIVGASWESLRSVQGNGPLGIVAGWFERAVKWQREVTAGSSGIVQLLFRRLPGWIQMPFVAVYGITQPVLPAVLIEPTLPIWRVLGIVRALGWYALLPLLMYAPIAVKSKPGVGLEPKKQNAWGWLAAAVWVWILVASLRAGGDQWDNPRYRVILLAFQALLAAEAWLHWRASGNAWMKRILAVEGLSILVIGYWYITRYLGLFVHLGVRNTLAIALLLAILVFAGGWSWDRWRARRRA